jgi:hypothetical protein
MIMYKYMRRMVEFQLDGIEPSPVNGKKWRVTFGWREFENGKWRDFERTADFGASGYEDYTTHHDKERRRLYRARHQHDLLERKPGKLYWTQPGVLAWHLLWGESTSLASNFRRYKRFIAAGRQLPR